MKFWQALLMNVAVVGAGLFAYDKLRCTGTGSEPGDPLAEAEMARFEKQYDEVLERRGSMSPRRARMAMYVEKMNLSLDKDGQRKLVDVLDGFQEARMAFWDRADAKAPDYDAKYRAFVNPWIAKVKALLPNAKDAEAVLPRFIWDGRIIRRPEEPGTAGPGKRGG